MDSMRDFSVSELRPFLIKMLPQHGHDRKAKTHCLYFMSSVIQFQLLGCDKVTDNGKHTFTGSTHIRPVYVATVDFGAVN